MYKIVSRLLIYGDMPKDSILMELADIIRKADDKSCLLYTSSGKNPQLVRKAGHPIGLQQSEAPADLWLDSLPGPDGVCLCS